jgi:hypothetical protein
MAQRTHVALMNYPRREPFIPPPDVPEELFQSLCESRGWNYFLMMHEHQGSSIELAEISHNQYKLNQRIMQMEEKGDPQEEIDKLIAQHKVGFEDFERVAESKAQLETQIRGIWKEAKDTHHQQSGKLQ